MQVKWKKLLLNLIIWLTAEVVLTFLGLDNMADYSEFIFSDISQREVKISC